MQYFISNNLNLTIFSNHNLDIKSSNSEIIPDTLSRLKSFTSVSIDPPQDELLFLLVEKFLKKKIYLGSTQNHFPYYKIY